MPKKTILIDVDDTIENLCDAWCKRLNKIHGTNVNWWDIEQWDLSVYFPKLTRLQLFAPLLEDDFWKTVKPKDKAAYYMQKLINDGYEIFLCTSTHYTNVKAKFEYVIKPYFPFIEWERVIVCDKKQMIKADYLVDDGIHNLVDGDYKKILFTAPHNKNCDVEKYGFHRADNWEQVYDIITKGL